MNIILLENIINLGKIGDKVKVRDGYGRNFLLRFGKALRFNKENELLVEKKKEELNKKSNEAKKKFKEIANAINNKSLTFNKRKQRKWSIIRFDKTKGNNKAGKKK